MDWIANAFWARVGWALGELALVVSVIAVVGVIAALIAAPRLFRQSRCKHGRFHETGACEAICTDCGKNLGFIGSVRASKIGVEA